MQKLETKYKFGETINLHALFYTHEYETCELCAGKGKSTIYYGNGTHETVNCCRCHGVGTTLTKQVTKDVTVPYAICGFNVWTENENDLAYAYELRVMERYKYPATWDKEYLTIRESDLERFISGERAFEYRDSTQ